MNFTETKTDGNHLPQLLPLKHWLQVGVGSFAKAGNTQRAAIWNQHSGGASHFRLLQDLQR
jgi:hypothetical protein